MYALVWFLQVKQVHVLQIGSKSSTYLKFFNIIIIFYEFHESFYDFNKKMLYLFSERLIKAPRSSCLHSSHKKVNAFICSVIKYEYDESNTSIPKSIKSRVVDGFQLPIEIRSLLGESRACEKRGTLKR